MDRVTGRETVERGVALALEAHQHGWLDEQTLSVILAVWGFRREGLGPTFLASTVILVAGALGIAVIAALRGTLTANPHILPLLLLYPPWGCVQQFLLQALVARNLHIVLRSPWLVTPIAAVLFGAVHLPDLELMGATFLLAVVFTPIYLRWRNLWPLGIYHGWLGVLAYYWILQHDPWAELFTAPS